MWIRCLRGERLPTASYARCPNLTNFFSCRRSSDRGGIEIVCRLFSTHQPTTHLRSRHRINPRSTRFVSGNAGAYRWRPPKCYVYQWSTGREVARDVLRSFSQFPRPEKCPFFFHWRWIEMFSRQFSTQQRSNLIFADAWQAPAVYHRPTCEL